MALKKYPPTILNENPSKAVADLLLTSKNVTSGAAVGALPIFLKREIIELAKSNGLQTENLHESIYWVINDLKSYPKLCVECGKPVQFRSYAEAYMYDRCSTKCSNSSNIVKNKKEKTSLDSFGVPYHFAANKIKEKIKRTNLEKYGCESNMQREEVFVKNMKSQYRLKKFSLPSGKIIEVMGFEPQAITWLLNNSYEEDDIVYSNIETIPYVLNNKKHSYRADLYLPKSNTLIEVKSSWTVKQNIDMNAAKFKAATESGFNLWLMVFKKDGTLIEERKYEA